MAQAEYFNFRHYEVENGLPSNTVRSIIQDSRGFIWFGTENGLSRFDGFTFKNFVPVPDDTSSLGNRYVYALCEDSKQQLWIGVEDGIYIYNPETEKFSLFANKATNDAVIRSQITSIKEDGNHDIWISSLSQGVFLYLRATEELINFTHDPNADNSLDSDVILDLYIDGNDDVWAAPLRKNGMLNRYDRRTKCFSRLELRIDCGRINDFGVYAMLEDTDKNFWVGTWSHGLCRLDRASGQIQPFLQPGTENGVSHIHEIIEYQPNILLAGSDDGLSIFNALTCESELMSASELKSSTLSDKFIYPIIKDNEGGLWVGTYYGGVNYAPPLKGNIAGFAHSEYENSVCGNIVSCFAEDSLGNIWIGTDDGGLSCFRIATKSFVNYSPDNTVHSLSYHNIHALCFDGDRLWIGTYSGGVSVLDTGTGRFRRYYSVSGDTSSLYGNSIYSIYKDSDNDLWFGSMEGISVYNRADDNFRRVKYSGTTTIDIIDDGDGKIWFATLGAGLLRYEKATGEWRSYAHDPKDAASMPVNQVNALHIDSSGRLWLATDNGLAFYDSSSDRFTTLPLLDGSNNNVCFVCNINGELWISTRNGLVNYSMADSTYRRLYRSDGLQSDQFNIKAGLLSASGHLYLGTTNGFNIIKTEEITTNVHVPPVYITNIQVANKDLKIDGSVLLPRSTLFADTIELSHRENVFSIEYIALSYKMPSKNRYKYRLEGFDADWNEVGNQRKATYMNLPTGRYVFHVAGSNNDEVWNGQGRRLTVIIHPPFWKTAVAYCFYAVLATSIFLLFISFLRRSAERKHREEVRQLQTEKDRELHESKINFFTLVAHEIRTPVSLIIAPLEAIMDNIRQVPDRMQESLYILNHNAQRLLTLVNQLLDFRKAEEKAFAVRFAEHRIYDLLNNLYIRFKPLSEQKNIALSLDVSDREATATVDSEALTKIVSNLLTNAVKHARSKISIACSFDDSFVHISVTDDGRGIPPEERKHIFRPFYQAAGSSMHGTGIGLSLVKLLVDAHHGKVEVDSIPNVHTAFSIKLPARQALTPAGPDVAPDSLPVGDKSALEPSVEVSAAYSSKPTILVADDSVEMRRFLSRSLREAYNVVEAGDGCEALEKLSTTAADIIVSDIMMPVMDGIEFTRTVKDNVEYSHIPVIMLTAKTGDATKLECVRTGADAYMEKPFSMKMLLAQMDNLLKSRMLLRKKFSEMPFSKLSTVSANLTDRRFLDRMTCVIEENLTNPGFSVDLLAEKLCISRSGLFAKMKTLSGMTPNELIQVIRLKKAAKLLSEGELRINEICFITGFNSPSYFSKCFRNQFGVLPKEFNR
jgi:signal transduction histidine kinase/ligand-binding sensor domain-containing protein/CheY-like chemotaxis protein